MKKMDETAKQFYWDTRPRPKLASAAIRVRRQKHRDRKTADGSTFTTAGQFGGFLKETLLNHSILCELRHQLHNYVLVPSFLKLKKITAFKMQKELLRLQIHPPPAKRQYSNETANIIQIPQRKTSELYLCQATTTDIMHQVTSQSSSVLQYSCLTATSTSILQNQKLVLACILRHERPGVLDLVASKSV